MRSKIKKSPEQKVSVSPIMLQCVSPVMAHTVNSDPYLEWSLSEA
jgi:hypothetical protein